MSSSSAAPAYLTRVTKAIKRLKKEEELSTGDKKSIYTKGIVALEKVFPCGSDWNERAQEFMNKDANELFQIVEILEDLWLLIKNDQELFDKFCDEDDNPEGVRYVHIALGHTRFCAANAHRYDTMNYAKEKGIEII